MTINEGRDGTTQNGNVVVYDLGLKAWRLYYVYCGSYRYDLGIMTMLGWVCPVLSPTTRWWLVDSPAPLFTQVQDMWPQLRWHNQNRSSNCGLRCRGARCTYTLMPEHGFRYGKSVTKVTQKSNNKTPGSLVQIRGAIDPNHTLTGLTGALKSPSRRMKSPAGTLSSIPPETPKRVGTLDCCLAHKRRQQFRSIPPTMRWREAILSPIGVNPNVQFPLTRDNSRTEESLAPLKESKLCVEASPTISTRNLSTSRASSGFFSTREVTFQIPRASIWT